MQVGERSHIWESGERENRGGESGIVRAGRERKKSPLGYNNQSAEFFFSLLPPLLSLSPPTPDGQMDGWMA